MKTNIINKQSLICILFVFFCSCASGPTDLEVLKLANPNGYILKKEIKRKGKSQKIQDTKVFQYTILLKYIEPGLTYGYQRGCPVAQCSKDVKCEEITDYLIGKDQWNEWKVFDVRRLEKKEIEVIWRPVSTSQGDFYKNYN